MRQSPRIRKRVVRGNKTSDFARLRDRNHRLPHRSRRRLRRLPQKTSRELSTLKTAAAKCAAENFWSAAALPPLSRCQPHQKRRALLRTYAFIVPITSSVNSVVDAFPPTSRVKCFPSR